MTDPDIIAASPWYVVLTAPAQDIHTVWRLHELGLEMYVPIIRERKPTGRRNQHGQKICVVRPRPMFPGYGFLRVVGAPIDEVRAVRGVRDLLYHTGRNRKPEPVILPHEAVLAVFAKQHAEHQAYVHSLKGRRSTFKPGDLIKIDDGGVYSGLVANIEHIDARGRIEVLFGVIRHVLPADMVVAA